MRSFIILFLFFTSSIALSYDCFERGIPGKQEAGNCRPVLDIGQYAKYCDKGEYPCNPVVYDIGHCIPDESGDTTKSCHKKYAGVSNEKFLQMVKGKEKDYEFYDQFFSLQQEVCDDDFGIEGQVEFCKFAHSQMTKIQKAVDNPSFNSKDGTLTVLPDGSLKINFPILEELSGDMQKIIDALGGKLSTPFGERPENSAIDDVYGMKEQREANKSLEKIEVAGAVIQVLEVRDNNTRISVDLGGHVHNFEIDSDILPMLTKNPMVKSIQFRAGSLYVNDGIMDHMMKATHLGSAVRNRDDEDCISSIKAVLDNPAVNKKILEEFLDLQKRITLNKLAHAYLKLSGEQKHLEEVIDELLKKKHAAKYEMLRRDFDKMAQNDPNQLNLLLVALSDVGDIINAQLKDAPSSYQIGLADLKFIAIMKEKNIGVNFIREVNQVYAGQSQKEKKLNLTKVTSSLEQLILDMSDKIKELIYRACFEPAGRSCGESKEEIGDFFSREFSQINSMLLDELLKKNSNP